MAEKNYEHVLDDVQTSDEEYSEGSCEESEGEIIPLSENDEDDDYNFVQNVSIKKEGDDDNPVQNVVIKEEVDIEEDQPPLAKRLKTSPSQIRPGPRTCGRGTNPIWWYHKQPPPSPSLEPTPNRYLPAIIGDAKNAENPLDAWSYLINDEMIELIVIHTNEEIRRTKKAHNFRQTYHKETDSVEMRACIGLLYLAGVYKQNTVNLTDLFGDDSAPNTFRATMPAQRFRFLLRCLCFDDKSSRLLRRKSDRFAACRDIWEMFIANCTKFYSPTATCTIDEQIEAFKGKCIFKMHPSNDSSPSGMKFILINDTRTRYMISAVPYLGKITDNERKESVPLYFVRKLIPSICDSGRTVVTCESFTSVDLFRVLDTEFGLKGLGSIRKKKTEIPSSFLEKGLPGTILCGTNNNLGLVSYVPKENKVMTILATGIRLTCVHATIGKPDIINTYNAHKRATYSFDQACKLYAVGRRTRRWPLRVFFSILDKANVNATIIYNLLHPNSRKKRQHFMKELSFALIEPQLRRRQESPTLRIAIRRKLSSLLGQEKSVQHHQVIDLPKRVKCSHCHHSSGVKTKSACPSCQEPICPRHRCALCVKCAHV
ncbi:uncharacterized protein LOC107045962 [Diachasma alloeum]|nr:uncharacterized protein LOC107045962 [Diachasma alloeum]